MILYLVADTRQPPTNDRVSKQHFQWDTIESAVRTPYQSVFTCSIEYLQTCSMLHLTFANRNSWDGERKLQLYIPTGNQPVNLRVLSHVEAPPQLLSTDSNGLDVENTIFY